MLPTTSQEDELYSIACEVSTMRFVSQKLPAVVVPQVYAYKGPGSQLAADAGTIYMLIEGFYRNTLQSVSPDLCSLPVITQEHIISHRTMAQAQLSILAYPQIGSICSLTESGEPVIGRLSMASAEGLIPQGPFITAAEHFTALGEAALRAKSYSSNYNGSSSPITELGPLAFLDIIQSTELFHAPNACFPLNHMDVGTQNILVDDDFNFLAIIDWEFAQTAPWQSHDDEETLKKQGQSLGGSFAEILDSRASRIYSYFSRLGESPEQDANYVREMIRLAYGFNAEAIDQYLRHIKYKLNSSDLVVMEGNETRM